MFSRGRQLHPNPPALAWPARPGTSGVRGAIRWWAVALGSVAAVVLLAGPAAAGTGSWQVVPGPSVPSGELLAVAGLGPGDVWAVGDYFTTVQGYKTLTEHWDGTAWTVVPSPGPGNWNMLRAVAPVTASDVWAVGFTKSYATLVLHWDGRAWTQVSSPAFGVGRPLYGVAAFGANDVWAVGSNGSATFVVHFDGTSWQQVAVPSPGGPASLYKVAGSGPATGSATDGWIVGNNGSPSTTFASMLEHWNGTTWSVSPSPVTGPGESELTGTTLLPDGTFWAVGARQQPNGTFTPLTLRHAPG